MEAVAPFALLLSLWSRSIPGWDPKAAGRRTRSGGDVRIHLMQHRRSLSAAAMENELMDVVCIRRFAGIDLVTSGIPDATTIPAPRHFLEKHPLGEKIFPAVREHLREEGLMRERAR